MGERLSIFDVYWSRNAVADASPRLVPNRIETGIPTMKSEALYFVVALASERSRLRPHANSEKRLTSHPLGGGAHGFVVRLAA